MIMIVAISALILAVNEARAQSIADLLEELTLDYQKLAGMKSILKQMQQGYQIVSTGYNSVKGVAKGNFSLHEAFLDGLLLVSPTVRNYPRVRDIINDQAALLSEYSAAYKTYKGGGYFNIAEIDYMSSVYNSLLNSSKRNLDELNMVMSDNKLRMSDDERLKAIDRIYASGRDELTFLRSFNERLSRLAAERAANIQDNNSIRQIYGIK